MATETAAPTEPATDTITFTLPAELVQLYRQLHPQKQRKWELVVQFQLEELAHPGRTKTTAEVMASLASQAAELGLTEEDVRDIIAWQR